MKRTIFFSALTLVLCLLWANPGFAASIFPTSYGEAEHLNPKWQKLGPEAGEDNRDGVEWNILKKGSTTWSAFGQETSLEVGDRIAFKVTMYKDYVGIHRADYLKVWMDWGQDGTFDEGNFADGGDVILFGSHPIYNPTQNATNEHYPFYSYYYNNKTTFEITEAMAGKDLYLRARVTCSDDLADLVGGEEWSMTQAEFYAAFAASGAVGGIGQGDYEEYILTVAPTPIPPSVFLFGSGLLGIMVATRRRFQA